MRLITSLFILQLLISGNSKALPVYVQGQWTNGPESVRLNYLGDATTAKSIDLKSAIDPISFHFEFILDLDYATMLQIENQSFMVLPGDTVNVEIEGIAGKAKLSLRQEKHGTQFSFTAKRSIAMAACFQECN